MTQLITETWNQGPSSNGDGANWLLRPFSVMAEVVLVYFLQGSDSLNIIMIFLDLIRFAWKPGFEMPGFRTSMWLTKFHSPHVADKVYHSVQGCAE